MAGFCFVLAVGVFLRLPSSLFSDPTSCFHRPESLHPQAGFSDNAEVNSALGELRQVQSKPGEAKQFYAATLTIDPIITGHCTILVCSLWKKTVSRLSKRFSPRHLPRNPHNAKTHSL